MTSDEIGQNASAISPYDQGRRRGRHFDGLMIARFPAAGHDTNGPSARLDDEFTAL
jgi:hypothetical protein